MFKLRGLFGASGSVEEGKQVPPPESRFGRLFSRDDKMEYEKPVIDTYAYDIDKWHSLILLDDDVAEAAIRLRSLGRELEDELAQRYLASMDKSKLAGLLEELLKRPVAERPSTGFPF